MTHALLAAVFIPLSTRPLRLPPFVYMITKAPIICDHHLEPSHRGIHDGSGWNMARGMVQRKVLRTLDQGNVLDRIRLDYGSGTVQSDRQPHNHHRSLPPSSVSCPADLPSPTRGGIYSDHSSLQSILAPSTAARRTPWIPNGTSSAEGNSSFSFPKSLPSVPLSRSCRRVEVDPGTPS
jgi:hypothetical protein